MTSFKEGIKESDDLLELLILATRKLKGIKITFRKHPAAEKVPQTLDIIGYFPTGEFQILFEKDGKTVDCIRGSVSFGNYEILGAGLEDPERFNNPEDVIKRVRTLLP